MKSLLLRLAAAVLLTQGLDARAADQILTVAVLDFECKETDLGDAGPQMAALTSALLSAEPNLITVERTELAKALSESELSLSGTVSSETAAKVGQLTGAKVLVTGRIFKAGKELLVVAKIISSETSRVYGEVVKGPADTSVSDLSSQLAGRISKIVVEKADTLVAKVRTPEERIADLKKALKDRQLPKVSIRIPERHYGQPVNDPAAETELGRILTECGFPVLSDRSTEKPDIEFVGEAFSAYGMRKGNLISCQARIEVKVIDKATGRAITMDRQTAMAVHLSEQIAAKTALQEAMGALAERIVPRAVK
jgi:hypothetical protein